MTSDCSTLRDFLPVLPVCVHERHERFLLYTPRVYVCFRSRIIKRSLLKCHQSSFDVTRKEPRKTTATPHRRAAAELGEDVLVFLDPEERFF